MLGETSHGKSKTYQLASALKPRGQQIAGSNLSNGIVLVKQLLEQVGEGLKIRSFQAVFRSDFPDNKD